MYDWGEQEERLEAADMFSAFGLVGCAVGGSQALKRWAASGRVMGLERVQPGMRFPRRQFEQPLRGAIPTLFEALETRDPWVVLNWLEGPLESPDGKTPRVAVERGGVERLVALVPQTTGRE